MFNNFVVIFIYVILEYFCKVNRIDGNVFFCLIEEEIGVWKGYLFLVYSCIM